jgi:hypothetical protein
MNKMNKKKFIIWTLGVIAIAEDFIGKKEDNKYERLHIPTPDYEVYNEYIPSYEANISGITLATDIGYFNKTNEVEDKKGQNSNFMSGTDIHMYSSGIGFNMECENEKDEVVPNNLKLIIYKGGL